jgi:peptide/nickel transport system permease protein
VSAVAAGFDQPVASQRQEVVRERIALLLRTPTFVAGGVIVVFWVACALFAGHIAPHDPLAPDILDKLAPPSAGHPLGTDSLGRDVLSRVLFGCRGVLVVAPLATLFGTVTGTAIGLVTGYFGGVVDEALMRVTDAFLALPAIIVALLALVALGPSTPAIIFVIGLTFAPIIARTVRAAVLSEANLDYVQAARLRQETASYVLFVEILPNVLGPVLVEFTVRLGYAIFATATLSFLGFGIQPPAPDWGLSIFEQYSFLIGGVWWPVLFPALAIASLVVAVNLVADGLGQALER